MINPDKSTSEKGKLYCVITRQIKEGRFFLSVTIPNNGIKNKEKCKEKRKSKFSLRACEFLAITVLEGSM